MKRFNVLELTYLFLSGTPNTTMRKKVPGSVSLTLTWICYKRFLTCAWQLERG